MYGEWPRPSDPAWDSLDAQGLLLLHDCAVSDSVRGGTRYCRERVGTSITDRFPTRDNGVPGCEGREKKQTVVQELSTDV